MALEASMEKTFKSPFRIVCLKLYLPATFYEKRPSTGENWRGEFDSSCANITVLN